MSTFRTISLEGVLLHLFHFFTNNLPCITYGNSHPTVGTVWHGGGQDFISWIGNCADMGTAGQAVNIDLVNGPSIAVRFVASLGNLNCSGRITTWTLTVPSNVAPGEYSLRIDTTPTIYSSIFQIDGPQTSTITPRVTTTGLTPTGPVTTKPNTSDSNVSPGLIGGIVAGVVVVVVIIAFFVRRNRQGEKR